MLLQIDGEGDQTADEEDCDESIGDNLCLGDDDAHAKLHRDVVHLETGDVFHGGIVFFIFLHAE